MVVFTRAKITLILLTLGFFIAAGYALLIPSKQELLSYAQGNLKNVGSKKSKGLSDLKKMHRGFVQKDLYLDQDGARLHYQISSMSSDLFVQPLEKSWDIVEHLQGIECFVQEKLLTNELSSSQEVKHFKADSGIYSYSLKQFKADKVHIGMYMFAGHELSSSLEEGEQTLHGVAKSVFLNLGDKAPHFQADKFFAETTIKK